MRARRGEGKKKKNGPSCGGARVGDPGAGLWAWAARAAGRRAGHRHGPGHARTELYLKKSLRWALRAPAAAAPPTANPVHT